MTTTKTSLICNNFAGIRRIDARFSESVISCSDCQNVELFNTGINSGVGIRTSKGNVNLTKTIVEDVEQSLFSDDEYIIEMFYTNLYSTDYCFVYTENTSTEKGTIYSYANGELTSLITDLTVTGNACGVNFDKTEADLFMFSNGEEIVKIDMEAAEDIAEVLSLTDVEQGEIKGLGFKVFNSRLWIFGKNMLWWSVKGDCTDFHTFESTEITSAGLLPFHKNITAIYPYLGSLAIFFNDCSALLTADSEDNFTVTDESPGGCASYDSLVFHGTDLFFYDDTKKGVFSFQQVVNGDKTLGQNIATDLQEELLRISPAKLNEIKALSVVLDDRNEVWFKLPVEDNKTTILIYDYIHSEWVKRVEQPINCINLVNNRLYSGGKDIYEEYNGDKFDGKFIQSYYYMTPMNLGSDTTLKMLYFPPRVTINNTTVNEFWVRYIKNYDFFKREKKKKITAKSLKNVLYYDRGMTYDSNYHYAPKDCTSVVKFPTNTFKTLEMRLYTETSAQGFSIRTIEFSKIKVKTA